MFINNFAIDRTRLHYIVNELDALFLPNAKLNVGYSKNILYLRGSGQLGHYEYQSVSVMLEYLKTFLCEL